LFACFEIRGRFDFAKIKLEGKLNDDVARHYYRQLISALEFMHERKICHRDLKLENLLVDQDGVLKISDFGLAGLHTGGDEVFKTTLGSPNYVAPEVLIGKGYNGFKADIWSSGVILYVL
jgi:5'-AMP-activated protein kinase catalytic alpha subunit